MSLILNVLPHAQVEHIGSSSIPGVISKGDLDIYVGVSSNEHEESVEILLKHGFVDKLDTLRTSELCMLISQDEDVALQIVARGSEFEFFIKFRDLLRESSDLVRKYNDVKLSCTLCSQEQYRIVKSKFIEQVLKNA